MKKILSRTICNALVNLALGSAILLFLYLRFH